MDAVYAAGVLGLIALAVWAATRHNQLFEIAIRGGRATVVRGHVPPNFLGDLRDIVRNVREGNVRAIKQSGTSHLVVSSSIDERTAQRLRNAFAVNPAANRRL